MIYNLTTISNHHKNILSTVTFSSIIITCLFFRQFSSFNTLKLHKNNSNNNSSNNNNNNNNINIHNSNDKNKFEKKTKELMYLQLYIPMSGTKGMTISIHNDFLLSKTIKDIQQSNILYIMLENKFNVSDGVVLKYISDTYSRCWDELMFQNKIKLQCIVSCDTKSFGFLSKEILLSQNNFINAFISDDNDSYVNSFNYNKTISSINNDRIQNGLFPFHIQHYSLPSYPTNLLYYLDSGDDSCDHINEFSKISNNNNNNHNNNIVPTYSKLAIGGTFDKLHNGHRKLLTLAASKCDGELTIGVISDSLLTKKTNSHLIETYLDRVQAIRDFFSLLKPSLKLNIVELHDPFGPTINDSSFEAIIVSSETLNGAIEINRIRKEKNYNELQILIMKRSDISTLSSTYLRDRELRERMTN